VVFELAVQPARRFTLFWAVYDGANERQRDSFSRREAASENKFIREREMETYVGFVSSWFDEY